MKKFIRPGALGVGVAALVLTGAAAAHAAGTYVSVNGDNTTDANGDPVPVSYTATNATPIAFNTNFGVKMTCAGASITGDIFRGKEVTPNNVVGNIGSLGFSSCSMPPFGLNVTMSGGDIEVQSDPTGAGADVPVTITGIHASIAATSGGTCTFDADGTLDAVIKEGTGTPDATLELVSAAFGSPDTGFTLTISNVVGCGGQVLNGDLAGAWDSDKVNGIPSIFDINTSGPLAGPVSHF